MAPVRERAPAFFFFDTRVATKIKRSTNAHEFCFIEESIRKAPNTKHNPFDVPSFHREKI